MENNIEESHILPNLVREYKITILTNLRFTQDHMLPFDKIKTILQY